MKNMINSLVPYAFLVLFCACLASVLGFLLILMTSIGFGDGMPFLYAQKLKIPEISIALPIFGMIFFAAILLGHSGNREAATKPIVIKGTANQTVSVEAKEVEEHPIAA